MLSRRWPCWGAAVLLMLSTVLLASATAAAPLTLWHAYRGAEREALEKLLREWTEAPVETLAIPYDAYAAKLAAAIRLGEGPDLFIDAHERLGDYRERSLVGSVPASLIDSSVYPPLALSAVSLEGERYGIPLSQKCLALYYNPRLVETPPKTVETMLAAEYGGSRASGSYLLVYENGGVYAHAPLLSAFGGRLLEPDDSFGFVGEAAVRSLVLAQHWVRSGVVPMNADGALVTRLFRAGKAAFAISGPWLASDLREAGISYRLAVLPILAETGRPMKPLLTVEALMFSPRGLKKPMAASLARWLSSAQAARLRQTRARTVSARQDVVIPPDDELLRVFHQQATQAVVMPSSTAMRAVWEPANRALKKVLNGTSLPKPALREAQRRFDDVRRPLPPARSPTPVLALLGLALLLGAWLLFQKAKDARFRRALYDSWPAYRYLVHAVAAVGLLVFVPLIAGAAISLYAGQPGQLYYVGVANFVEILTARGGPLLASGSFYLVLVVTVLWTVLNLIFHLAIGTSLGVLLARPHLRGRAAYRVLLILPWAVPSYVTALAWKGMFHSQFGAITGLIQFLNERLGTDVESITWFARFSTSFTANLATNVWLGFPFIMVVTMSALTAVPSEVLEAAEVDGATRVQRFFRVTLPIIRPSMLPAVVLGAIWTFNMFNVVFLVSGGEPDGQTDILVSEAYRWAFTRQAQYGYAAAYAVLIFALLFGAMRLPAYWLAGRRKLARLRARRAVA